MIDLARRQVDPAYSAKCHIPAPPNAFVHPELMTAVFPKKQRPKLVDLRSEVVEGAKTAMPVNFRKKVRSEYSTKVWTAEDLKKIEMEEMANLVDTKLVTKEEEEEKVSEDDNMEEHFEKLGLGKKVKDVKMKGVAEKGKAIKKGGKNAKKKFKSYRIVNF